MLGYIGLGLLGSAFAEDPMEAGFTVRGFDIAPEREHEARGGVPARSPADAARGVVVIDNSTIHPDASAAQGLDGTALLAMLEESSAYRAEMGPRGARAISYTGAVFAEDTGRP